MLHRLRLPRTYWADRSLLAFLIATTAWLSLTLARGPGELAAIWVGNGILTGWLLSRRTATWPGYIAVAFAAELPARMLAGDEPSYAFAIAACNLLEVLTVAGVVRSRVPDIRAPKDWVGLGGIATGSTLMACAVSGLIAASVAQALHGQDFVRSLGGWYAAHVVGMVILATTTLVAQRGLGLFIAPGRRWSLAITMAVLVAVGSGVFLTSYPVLFLTYPALLLVAMRHQFVGVALGVIALGLIAAVATTLGHGPLWLRQDLDGAGRIALLQIYLAGGCLMTIPMCLAMAERKRLAARLGESERRYRMLADHSHDVIARIRADGERVYVSPSAAEMFGRTPAEMLGSRWDIVHPDDVAQQRQAMAEVLATGETRTDIYRVRHKDGHHVWIEAVARCIPADDGSGPPDLMLTARNISRRVAAEQALAESRRELERLSRVDALTDLANRRQFEERFALALKRLQRHGMPVALMCLDIDHFKQINDGHGHAAGDTVLQVFAKRLCDSVRETDLVARLGGDEFVILIEDAAPGAAETIARKVVDATAGAIDASGTLLTVTTSIGIAYAQRPTAAAKLMAMADAALYEAKKAGRNRYEVATVS
ncbi:sensor domain-containing diguanylate cyclase [Luteimonas sp. MC1572]|uniref:sensor domain-containing diguanylate cyclase n=1 Tax=Luteimonas sp. MC1572 TaxID=2799325 RepID=UPI0018F09BD3|nr:sensor domain-containing diguanylate cyclase [Luteimonas sp. MC1572]MBJ6981742.1 diguanylate cyclase [Luteimonas sp. MC1572]QQO03030.1 diguanylate cyclase [Luteimonas sp. MC1572]